ncbi:gene transfer agent family protein [Agrobacterium rosae]|uniref:Gene transfer agent family protein n=1 Tax=Agrobacterium rosae TaxID=1972867 RepID=A0AAW9FF33_9HYPH|nr:gene transfer agent family protein [Agrobacterium rosae]MDX8301224.1 gene transfer agent family protein [Agrobacterium rosae]
MHHTAYFGDGEKTFALTTEMIHELERTTGIGIAALYARFMRQDFHFADMIEIIRTGLIGGGTSPLEAQTLIDTYAKPRPIMEVFPLAFYILDARWNGTPEAPAIPVDDTDDDFPAPVDIEVWRGGKLDRLISAAATGDMSAAINASLEQVAE